MANLFPGLGGLVSCLYPNKTESGLSTHSGRKKASRQEPTILHYVDYRDYLSDYFKWRKATQRGFSHRRFAAEVGVGPSHLLDIINGRQNLNISVMNKYADAMSLSKRDRTYFESMVGLTNSKTNEERNRWFNTMAGMRERSTIAALDHAKYEYFSKWYIPVVREYVDRRNADTSLREIADAIRPRPSVPQVRRALQIMKKLDLVYIDENNRWRKNDKVLASETGVHSIAMTKFHYQMMDHARDALDWANREEREFQTLTLSGSRVLFRKIKKLLQQFSLDLAHLAAEEKEPVETVFQVNLQQFPFVQNTDTDKREDSGGF